MSSGRFGNLDALRGICALTVMLLHCGGLLSAGQSFCHGYLAVDIFFILSGFVIAHAYEQRLAEGLTVGEFLKRRLIRLAPVYWVGTLLCVVAFALIRWNAGDYTRPEIAGLAAMSMVLAPRFWFRDYAYPVNLVAWSLAGELIANLVYARWLHRYSSPTLLALTAAGWSLCLLYALTHPSGWDFGALASDFYMGPVRAVPGFLAGVVLFRVHRAGRLARLPDLPPVLMLMAWVLLAAVPSSGPTPLSDFLVVTIGGPAIIALLARSPKDAPAGLLWLGAISYPLYASHRALVSLALQTHLVGTGHGLLRGTLVIAGMLALAALIHRAVETKAPRAGRGLMKSAELA